MMFRRRRTYKIEGDFSVREKRPTVLQLLMRVLNFLLITVTLTLCYYLVFALVFDTDVEKALKEENRAYEKIYDDVLRKLGRLEDVTAGLESKDDHLYEEIFHTPAPFDTRMAEIDLLSVSDTLTEATMEARTEGRIARNERRAAAIEADFRKVYQLAASRDLGGLPMHLPLRHFNYARTGAGVGMKVSPFTNVPTTHYGIDLMAASGDPVIAPADAVVAEVIHSRKTQGNRVVLQHGGGYRTSYSHLSEIKVRKGMKVRKGQVIASVGMSGNTYAPHLHYEVLKDTVTLDPMSFFFMDLMPREYANMLVISSSTGRSMD